MLGVTVAEVDTSLSYNQDDAMFAMTLAVAAQSAIVSIIFFVGVW